ncbi:MAG: hypothetical protein QM487_03350 [Candidatus Marithrix sp.]
MKKVFSINECFPKLNRKQQLGEAWQSIDWKTCQTHVDRLQNFSCNGVWELQESTRAKKDFI